MPHTSDVVVIGNAGIDTNIYLPGQEIDFSVEANFTENIDYIGQAGGYASLGYARLGYQTAYIGYIGEDCLGRHILDEFARHEIDTNATFFDPLGTARSVNFMYPDGRRKNFYDGKGHMSLAPDPDSCREVLAGARLAHFNIPNWARQLLPAAREAGLTIACDIQDAVDLADPYRSDFIQYADILFLSGSNFSDPEGLLRSVLEQYPQKMIVCGLGPAGCAVGDAGTINFYGPVELPEPVIDTNGAGDSLAVGFLSSYVLEGYSLQESVLRGQIAARHACSLKANSANLITRSRLDDWFGRLKAGYRSIS